MFPLQTFIFFFCFCLFRSSIISNFVALFAWFYACPRKKVSYSCINTLKISNVSNFLLSKTIRTWKVLNVSILWRTFRCCSNFCPYRGSNPRHWGTSAPEAKVLTTGPPAVPFTFRIGAWLYSTTCK